MKYFYILFLFLSGLNASAQVSAVDTYIQNYMNTKKIPGAAVVMVKNGRVVYERYFGYADLDKNKRVSSNTIFMIASISKTITATALMNEVENGKLNIEDSIDELLPFVVRNPSHPDVPITFKHLLTHTSSIEDDYNTMANFYSYGDSPMDLNTMLSKYLVPGGQYYTSDSWYTHAPGTTYQYSNIGTALMGYLVERSAGYGFDQYSRDSIFDKICMENTSWFLKDLDSNLVARPYYHDGTGYYDHGLYGFADYPDGQLRTTAISLAKFMQMHMNNGIFDNSRVLDSATVLNMRTTPYAAFPDQGLIFYKIAIPGRTLWGHNGSESGVSTNMYFDLNDKTGVLVLANSAESTVPIIQRVFTYANEVAAGSGTPLTCSYVNSTNDINPDENSIRIFPNPANESVKVLGENIKIISVFNPLGQDIQVSISDNTLDVSELKSGVYFIEIENGKGQKSVQRFIKN